MKTDPNSKEGMEPLITIAATKQLVDEMVPMGRTFNVYEVERALGMMRGTYESERRADKARIAELEKVVTDFRPNSEAIIDGASESWRAAGYEDPDRAAERFRGGLRQSFIVGWHESRMHLSGQSVVKSSREVALEARIKELEGLAKELIAALKHRLEGTREDCSDELSSFGEPQLSINHGWQVLAKAAELIPSNT